MAYAGTRDAFFLVLFGQGFDEDLAGGLIDDAGPLFAEAAFAAMQLGENEKGPALAAEGRARMLALALKRQTLDLPKDKRERLDVLRAEIPTADRTL